MGFVNRIGQFFFTWRDKLPVPLALAMVSCARPRRLGWFLGLPLVFTGELLRLWGLMHIGPTTRTREICADRLITGGPYSHCRNPLYLANFLKILGFMTIAANPGYALLVILFYVIEFSTMIPYEEGFLAEKFPEAHKCYRESVSAFVPSLTPVPRYQEPANYSFKEAMVSERRTFASTAAILLVLAACALWRKGKRS